MTLLYLIVGIGSVALLLEYSPKFGGLLAIILILSLLFVAKQKGVI